VLATHCTACGRLILFLRRTVWERWTGAGDRGIRAQKDTMVWPTGGARSRLPKEVPPKHAKEYREAALVLSGSAKASAAISRRCLQLLLREAAGVKPCDLAAEIQEVLDRKMLPTHLAEAIDAIRTLGNFAAHPIKSKNTGEIISVEPGEAEWLLDTLDGLFDFFFVRPAVLNRKRDALNKKLADAGKSPLK